MTDDWRRDLPSTSKSARQSLARVGPLTIAVLVLGGWGISYYVHAHYPLADVDDSLFTKVAAGVAAVSIITLFWKRRAMFPWSRDARDLFWSPLVLTASLGFIMPLTALTFINGAFDRGAPQEVEAVVTDKQVAGRIRRHYLRLAPASTPAREPMLIEVPEETYSRASVGGRIIVRLKPGRLRRPWVVGLGEPRLP